MIVADKTEAGMFLGNAEGSFRGNGTKPVEFRQFKRKLLFLLALPSSRRHIILEERTALSMLSNIAKIPVDTHFFILYSHPA